LSKPTYFFQFYTSVPKSRLSIRYIIIISNHHEMNRQ